MADYAVYVVWSRLSDSLFGVYSNRESAEEVRDALKHGDIIECYVDSGHFIINKIKEGLRRYRVEVGEDGKARIIEPIPLDCGIEDYANIKVFSNGSSAGEYYLWAKNSSDAKERISSWGAQ